MIASLLAIGAAGAAAPGAPDTLVTSDCLIEQSGFTDLDVDGVDDLVVQSGYDFFAWPSASAGTTVHWSLPSTVGDPEGIVAYFSSSGLYGTQLLWVNPGEEPGDGVVTEYLVDSATFALTSHWVADDSNPWLHYAGDLDGDGFDDPMDRDDLRLSATATWLELTAAPGSPFTPFTHEPLGDLNGDGYADLLVGQREEFDPYDKCVVFRGPGELQLGSPAGPVGPPVWTIFALGYPNTALGREVAVFPDEDALLVTIVKEGIFCSDVGPGYVGVIRDASTPAAYLDQVLQVSIEGDMPYLFGILDGSVLFLEPWRALWFDWDPVTRTLADTPTVWWPTDRVIDLQHGFIAFQPGRRNQAMAFGTWSIGGEPGLLVWGRTVDDVGPSPSGSTAGSCTFWAEPFTEAAPPSEPPLTEPTEEPAPTEPTIDLPPAARPPAEPEGCSCEAVGGPPLGGLLVGLALASVRRRSSCSAVPSRGE